MAELRRHNVVLTIAGQPYSGWERVRVMRSLDSLTGAFELELADRQKTGGTRVTIRATDPCTLSIDGALIITGHVDRLSQRVGAEDHLLSAAGRDKAADLVDCSAVVSPGSWRNVSMEAIVAELLKPFGVSARFTADTGAKIRRFALQPGEPVHAAIERLCRFRALCAWSEPDGRVVIGNPANGPAVGRLTEGVNLAEIEVTHDAADRYSHYVVKGQAAGDNDTNGRAAAQVKATATDPAITRYRPLIIIAEDQATIASLKKRAEWEANVRAARSQTVTIMLPGWYDPAGTIWAPRSRVQVVSQRLGIDLVMLVVAVELSRGEDGTITRLTLQPPEAWQQLTVPEKADASSLRRAA